MVENFGSLASLLDGRSVGTIGKVKAGEAIVAGGKPNPGGYVTRRLLNRVAEVTLRQAVAAAIKMFDTQLERLVGPVILDVLGLLHCQGCRWRFRLHGYGFGDGLASGHGHGCKSRYYQKTPYGQKIETAQRRQRSNIFGLWPVLHNKLAVDA